MILIMNARRFFFLLFAVLGMAMVFCTREVAVPVKSSPYVSLQGPVDYVGMKTCQSCHANIHETFIHTGMGRSFDRATQEKSDAAFGDHALVYDEASDFYYKPFFRDSQMYVLEYRLEGEDTVYQRLEEIAYIVGSGQHTNSHILDINGYIYQAPVTYYTQEKRWDMAPGFRGDNIRFSRLLASECITCHNHFPKLEEGSINKFTEMPSGIACERCHGPGEAHVKEKLAGNIVDTSKAIDYSIVNPADLPRDLQMDLCQRCHLQGIAVLNPGKTFYDFKPGMPLSDVVNVFLPRYTDSHERFIMASQADRLRMSACYLNSDMTCLTCHNPHRSIEATAQSQYNNACQGCHQTAEQVQCAAPQAERAAAGDDCSGCHMPRSGSIDIPHVNITDHYISRDNIRGQKAKNSKQVAPAFLGLEILTKEEGSPLEMARGYLAMYDKYVQADMVLDSAWAHLERSQAQEGEQLPVRIHYYFARKDYAALLKLADGAEPEKLASAWPAYQVGEALFQAGRYAEALGFYQRACELLPLHLDFQEKLGATYLQLQQLPEAVKVLEGVLEENPKRPVAWTNLGFAHVLQGQARKGEACYDRALALDPDAVQALLNKAAVRMLQYDKAGALQLVQRALRAAPAHPQARALMQQLTRR